MGQLDGRVAIVTGSSRGVGYFMARELAREGCNIVVAARSERVTDPNLPGTIYSVAQELERSGVQALPVRTDVTDDESIAACVAATRERFGRIDVLINNAGVMSPASVVETPLRRLDLIHRVNVRGPFAMTQAVLPTMLEQRSGTVISVSSIAADQSGAGNATYAMSKQAVEKFTEGAGRRGWRCRPALLRAEAGGVGFFTRCALPRIIWGRCGSRRGIGDGTGGDLAHRVAYRDTAQRRGVSLAGDLAPLR